MDDVAEDVGLNEASRMSSRRWREEKETRCQRARTRRRRDARRWERRGRDAPFVREFWEFDYIIASIGPRTPECPHVPL